MFRVRGHIYADSLELWLHVYYMIGLRVVPCGRYCLIGLRLEVRFSLTNKSCGYVI